MENNLEDILKIFKDLPGIQNLIRSNTPFKLLSLIAYHFRKACKEKGIDFNEQIKKENFDFKTLNLELETIYGKYIKLYEEKIQKLEVEFDTDNIIYKTFKFDLNQIENYILSHYSTYKEYLDYYVNIRFKYNDFKYKIDSYFTEFTNELLKEEGFLGKFIQFAFLPESDSSDNPFNELENLFYQIPISDRSFDERLTEKIKHCEYSIEKVLEPVGIQQNPVPINLQDIPNFDLAYLCWYLYENGIVVGIEYKDIYSHFKIDGKKINLKTMYTYHSEFNKNQGKQSKEIVQICELFKKIKKSKKNTN